MKIELVSSQPDRAGRYKVLFSDGTTMRLYRKTVEDFTIYSGREMEPAEFSALQKAAGEMSAKMRAVRIVSASGVSKADLERRLVQKGEAKQDAAQAVAWLEDLDLLDDSKIAQQGVQKCIAKGYGLSRAKQALYEKRVPKEYWDDALADYPDQTERIMDFLQTRLGDDRDEKQLRRAMDALLRRGHSYQEIRRALNRISEDVDFQEEMYG